MKNIELETQEEFDVLTIKIEEKQVEIEEKEYEIDGFELECSEYENAYDDMLDDCYPELFNMLPSRILSECDPIAYRCGLNDYVDGLDNVLSGTVAYKRSDKSFLLVVTKDSEINHVENITFEMIKILVKNYCSALNNKVVFATNLTIEIHSSKAEELKKDFNFHIQGVGFSFCQKHNLEFTSMY